MVEEHEEHKEHDEHQDHKEISTPKKTKKKITISFTPWQGISAVLAVLLVISISTGGFSLFGGSDSGGVAAEPQEPSRFDVSADDDAVLGDSDAPVTIIEFSDYECPFCARFWSQTLPALKSEYIDTGKAKLVYRDLPLPFHANAQKAAEAAECAGDQDKYWDMHDKIFENQAIEISDLKGYAGDLGLDTAEFNSCLDSGKHEDEVNKDYSDASKVGASGTPTFFIGNDENGYVKIVGAQPFAVFQQVIDAELA